MGIKQLIAKIKFSIPRSRVEWHHKADHFFHMTYTGIESWQGHPPLQYVAWGMFGLAVLGIFIVSEGH